MYWTLGWLGSVIVAMVWGLSTSNEYLLASVFLAFATVFPDFEVRLFFVIPVKVKWLGWLTALGLLALIGVSDQWSRLFPVVAVGNYLLFFWVDLVDMLRGYVRRAGHAQQFGRFQTQARQGDDRPARACAACGVTDADPSIDFRVCSCDKCKKPTTFCLEHARNH
jgi:hypothetical protein